MSTSKKTGARQLVNRTAFSGALDNDLLRQLDQLHKETQIPKNRLYDEAVALLLNKHNKGKKTEESSS